MKLKVSLVLNIIIVFLVITASVMMFAKIRLMGGDVLLETSRIGMFKFFTVDSNIFMGLVSFIFIIKEIGIIKGKEKEIPKNLYILKLAATTSVTLTFITVFGYLGFIAEGGVLVLLKNSNLFFHLIIPVVSIITFIFFEKTNKINFKSTFLGIIPMIIYGVIYTINVLIHLNGNKVDPVYDFYYFVQGGIQQVFIVVPIMFIITYIISFILWKINRTRDM